MLKIMKRPGMSKKRVRVQRIAARREERQDEFNDATLVLDDKIYELQQSDAHIVYVDETLFKGKDFQKTAWSNMNANVKVYDRTYKQDVQAVSTAICNCHGVIGQV